MPVDDWGVALVLIGVVIGLLLLIFTAPFLWILLLFVLDLLVWLLLAAAGVGAWLLFGRPWRVVVVDDTGSDLAMADIRGWRRARAHASIVQQRLASGATPTAAVLSP